MKEKPGNYSNPTPAQGNGMEKKINFFYSFKNAFLQLDERERERMKLS